MATKTVDLDKYAKGVSILAGRERGEEVRRLENLDVSDSTADEHVVVVIPDYVDSVNSSFFLGMFEKSVLTLGEDGFRAKYEFRGPSSDSTREDGIRTALLMGHRFRPKRAAARA